MKNTSNYEIKYAKNISPNFTLLGEYVNMHNNTLIRCNRCNKEWSPTPTNFLRRIKCKFCENKTIKKPDITPNIIRLSGKPCILYILHIVNMDKYEDNGLKIGITTKDLKYRLASINSEIGDKYNIRVLKTYFGDSEHISLLEKTILKNLDNYKHSIEVNFSGQTEVLSVDAYNSIINIMEKYGYNV